MERYEQHTVASTGKRVLLLHDNLWLRVLSSLCSMGHQRWLPLLGDAFTLKNDRAAIILYLLTSTYAPHEYGLKWLHKELE